MPIEKFEISGNSYQETSENMPSLKFPSEIKTCKDNITIVKSNKNLLSLDLQRTALGNVCGMEFENDKLKIKMKGTAASAWARISLKDKIHLKKDKDYTLSCNVVGTCPIMQISVSFENSNGSLLRWIANTNSDYKGIKTSTINGEDYDRTVFIIEALRVGANYDFTAEIQFEENDKATDIVEHKEERFVVPVQQEMLEGDYFDLEAQEEVHTWEKVALNGAENWTIANRETTFENNIQTFVSTAIAEMELINFNYIQRNVHCNWEICGKATARDISRGKMYGIECGGQRVYVCLEKFKDYTLEEFKQFLKEKYEEGKPLYIYYKLAEQMRLKLTQQQVETLEQLQKTRTYKNETIFYSTDEVSPIISVTYKKDSETINKQTEDRLTAIENLLTTTATSALLLDNLQSDLESEV